MLSRKLPRIFASPELQRIIKINHAEGLLGGTYRMMRRSNDPDAAADRMIPCLLLLP